MMGRVGPLELVIILVIVLMIFGPSQLPKLAQSAGRAVREWRQVRRQVDDVVDDARDAGQKVAQTVREGTRING
jgi:sec-independent protein translocase protein TatA